MSFAERRSLDAWLRRAGRLTLVAFHGGGLLIFLGLHYLHATHGDLAPTVALGDGDTTGMPSRIATMMGTVERLGNDVITVKMPTEDGDVRIDARTRVITQSGPATLADVQPGARLLVWAAPDARGQLLASVLLVGPAP